MIKVTVRKNEKTEEKIDFEKLPFGTVVEFHDGVKAVVYQGVSLEGKTKEMLLLNYLEGYEPAQALGYKSHKIIKVLGTIKEVIVGGYYEC